MSRFNRYAVKLSEAFKAAREEYREAAEAYTKAKADYSETQKADYFYKEKFFGEKELRIAKLKAEVAYTEKEVNAAFSNAWDVFQVKVRALENELNDDMKAFYRASPNQIEESVITLLSNGIFDTGDISDLISQYRENPTMLKVIANYASKKAEQLTAEGKLREATDYKILSGSAESEDKIIAKNWDALKDVSHTLFGHGESGSGTNTGLNLSLMARWEELVNPLIESF